MTAQLKRGLIIQMKRTIRVINDGSVKDLNLNNEKTKFTNNLDYHETWFSLQELWAKTRMQIRLFRLPNTVTDSRFRERFPECD